MIISDYQLVGYNNDQQPSERIKLSFTKFELAYIPYSENNTQGNPIPMGYDLALAKLSQEEKMTTEKKSMDACFSSANDITFDEIEFQPCCEDSLKYIHSQLKLQEAI